MIFSIPMSPLFLGIAAAAFAASPFLAGGTYLLALGGYYVAMELAVRAAWQNDPWYYISQGLVDLLFVVVFAYLASTDSNQWMWWAAAFAGIGACFNTALTIWGSGFLYNWSAQIAAPLMAAIGLVCVAAALGS